METYISRRTGSKIKHTRHTRSKKEGRKDGGKVKKAQKWSKEPTNRHKHTRHTRSKKEGRKDGEKVKKAQKWSKEPTNRHKHRGSSDAGNKRSPEITGEDI